MLSLNMCNSIVILFPYSQEAVHFMAPTKSPVKDEAEAQQAPGMYQDLEGMDQNSSEREKYELCFELSSFLGGAAVPQLVNPVEDQ